MINIALLGFGTIGGGVAGVLEKNGDMIAARLHDRLNIKYILDLREFPDSPYHDRIVHDMNTIVSDPEVSVVVEMMGGVHPAVDFTEAALKAGKSVVTSNKAAVAARGPELLAIARENGVRYLFEASVGGGIPVIRPIIDDLASNEIICIRGILNGTTNYMLTKMTSEGASYADVLKEAQKLGYAEADPTADVEGFDAARKILILAALAYGKLIPLDRISVTGISGITKEDIAAAAAEGKKIKLIASVKKDGNGKILAKVAPEKVAPSSLLYSVDDVFNAVEVTGNMLGEAVFYGKGAGRDATAGAVVADIIDAAEKKFAAPPRLNWKWADVSDIAEG